MTRATSFLRAGMSSAPPSGRAVLSHAERHLRRRLIVTETGDDVLVDLPVATVFEHGDCLVLEDGLLIEIAAADEELMEVKATSREALTALAWHLGNRHLPAEIGPEHIRVARDHVIRDMLSRLGAEIADIRAPFSPLRGAYHDQGHDHGHGQAHAHDHGHSHAHD